MEERIRVKEIETTNENEECVFWMFLNVLITKFLCSDSTLIAQKLVAAVFHTVQFNFVCIHTYIKYTQSHKHTLS